MKATTIKLESDLLEDIARAKPKDQSLTAFVKQAVKAELARRHLRKSAQAYQNFLSQNKAEQDWLDQWEQADLAIAAKSDRSKS
ncbi:MAG: hypothetical protein H6714_11245 [Myxococcales bacterium]|nr:hypothetical protein [Myxococcales bacterium]